MSDLPSPGGLLAVLPRGETFRTFVYSGVLARVRDAVGAHAVAVHPNDALTARLAQDVDSVSPLEGPLEHRVVRGLRGFVDLAHTRWLWSRGAQDRWRRRTLDAADGRARWRWGVKKMLAGLVAHRGPLKGLHTLERRASRWLRRDDDVRALLDRLRPDLVFNASHVHSENAIRVLQAAHWAGVPTATFIYSWDNLTSQGRIFPPHDHYLVWNRDLAVGLRRLYPWIAPSRIHVTGTPQFDAHADPAVHESREAFCARVGADPARPLIVYGTGMANHMPGEPHIVEGLADLIREPAFGPRHPQLLLRVYPKDTSGRFQALAARRPDILVPEIPWETTWLTPTPEDTAFLSNTLRHADVGINVASTLALEHLMFDTPVVHVGYNPPRDCPAHLPYARYYAFDHFRPVVASGAVEVARSRDDMRRRLRAALRNPGARAPQRRALLTRMFGDTLDGQSGARVARCLIRLVRHSRSRSS